MLMNATTMILCRHVIEGFDHCSIMQAKALSFFLVHRTQRAKCTRLVDTDYFDSLLTKFMINNRTDTWKTCVNLLNRFHVALRLFSNRSQKTSKSGNISDTLGYRLVCHFCHSPLLIIIRMFTSKIRFLCFSYFGQWSVIFFLRQACKESW